MAIEGNLKDMSLVDIVQFNCRGQTEACVTLQRGGQTGAIYFASGQVVHAECGADCGEEAFYRLMQWHEGDFVIEREVPASKQSIMIPWEGLLMQTLHRIDEERGVSAASPQESGDREMLEELAERVDGFVAGAVTDIEGTALTSLVRDDALEAERVMASLTRMVQQVNEALDIIDAGQFEETITITSRYRFITRPANWESVEPSYIQVIIGVEGNIGAARMYLAAYLLTQEEQPLDSLPRSAQEVLL
jgi:predicted regulator of Ras-like GTPase activity (Roadblock/LC7/MglB family)